MRYLKQLFGTSAADDFGALELLGSNHRLANHL